MVRPLKIGYPGAVYHVNNRGNAWQNIFSMTMIGLRSLRSFTRAYREHTMKKIADYLGIPERRGRELAVGVASEKEQSFVASSP